MSEQDLRIQRQIDWLKNASPEDWHRVASSFDVQWDGPIDPLFWIVRQDECDKATALTVFWKMHPQGFLGFLADNKTIDDRHRKWELAQYIAKRLNENGFTTSEIAFEATSYIESDYEKLVSHEQQLAQSPLETCDDMKMSVPGKRIGLNGEFAKRYPSEFHNEKIREEYLTALQIDYLETGSPDDWHEIAFDWNWDDRLDVLYWIVSQPECDKATALTVFWKGEPACYDYETEEAEMGDDIYAVAPMLKYISERFNTTGYHRSGIEFNYDVAKGLYTDSRFAPKDENGEIGDVEELVERQKDLANPNVKLHPDMKRSSISGRKVGKYGTPSPFYNEFPAYFDIDGSELGSGPLMNFDGDVIDIPLDENVSARNGAASKNQPEKKEEPLKKEVRESTNDADSDSNDGASARIRAMRHQTDEDSSNPDNVQGLMARLRRFFGG